MFPLSLFPCLIIFSVFLLAAQRSVACYDNSLNATSNPIDFYLLELSPDRHHAIWVSVQNMTVSRAFSAAERAALYSLGLHPPASLSRVTLPRSLTPPIGYLSPSFDIPRLYPYANYTDFLLIAGGDSGGGVERGAVPTLPPDQSDRNDISRFIGTLTPGHPDESGPIHGQFVWEDHRNNATEGFLPPLTPSELENPGLAFTIQLDPSGHRFKSWNFTGFYFVPEFDCASEWKTDADKFLESAEQQPLYRSDDSSSWLFELRDLPASFRGYHFILAVPPHSVPPYRYNPLVSWNSWSQQPTPFQDNVEKVNDDLWVYRSPSFTFKNPFNMERGYFIYQLDQQSANTIAYFAKIVMTRDLNASLIEPSGVLCSIEPQIPHAQPDANGKAANIWIIAIVVGAVVGVVLLVLIAFVLIRRQQKNRSNITPLNIDLLSDPSLNATNEYHRV